MRHAATAAAIVLQLIFGCFVLVPRRHTRDDLRRQNDITHLSQPGIHEHASLRFWLTRHDNRLKNTAASFAVPPSVVNTDDVKHHAQCLSLFTHTLFVFYSHVACRMLSVLIGGMKTRMDRISAHQKMRLDTHCPKTRQHKYPIGHCHPCSKMVQGFHQ